MIDQEAVTQRRDQTQRHESREAVEEPVEQEPDAEAEPEQTQFARGAAFIEVLKLRARVIIMFPYATLASFRHDDRRRRGFANWPRASKRGSVGE